MTHVSYLVAGWGSAAVILAVYVYSVLSRARRLTRRVPVERQRWMSSDDAARIGDS